MNTIALIPARGGSKGIPRKNLLRLAGHPLIHYSIKAALVSSAVGRTLVSTDDPEIAEVALREGAEVPFMRPQHLAEDGTGMLAVMQHAMRFVADEGRPADAIVLLQPTSPLRPAGCIDEAIGLLESTGADSVVSVTEVPHQFNPTSVMSVDGGRLTPYLAGDSSKVYRRQDKPVVYARNGPSILVSRHATIVDRGDLYGDDCRPLVMTAEWSVDIDAEYDFKIAELLMGDLGYSER